MMLELLLQLSWQGAAVAVLVLILRALFGRYLSARWRHALWLLVLGRLLIPALPQSHASLFMLGNLIRRDVPTDTMPMVHFPSQPQMWRVSVIDNSIPSGSPKAAKLTEPWWHRSGVIQLVWMSIAAVLLLRLVISNWIFNRQLKQHPKTNSQHIQRLFDACRNELRVTRHCELQISDAVSAPATYGIFRPCVLLPECMASSQKESDLRLIFLHELSHIKCHDVVLEWLWAVLQCVHWFNPILWAMAPLRKMDREQARDEMVLTLAGADQSVAYGQILLNLASDSAFSAEIEV